MAKIIATREFTYKLDDKTESLLIKIYKPTPDKRIGGDWECTFFIDDTPTIIYGVDSLQALLLAQQALSVKLNLIKENKFSDLNWLGIDDLGF